MRNKEQKTQNRPKIENNFENPAPVAGFLLFLANIDSNVVESGTKWRERGARCYVYG